MRVRARNLVEEASESAGASDSSKRAKLAMGDDEFDIKASRLMAVGGPKTTMCQL